MNLKVKYNLQYYIKILEVSVLSSKYKGSLSIAFITEAEENTVALTGE